MARFRTGIRFALALACAQGIPALTRFSSKASVIIAVIVLTVAGGSNDYKNDVYVDPDDIADAFLPITIPDDTNKWQALENGLKNQDKRPIDIRTCLAIVFRYRDPRLIPVYFEIIGSKDFHSYFKLQAVYALGETADSSEFHALLAVFKTEKNDLIREYIACALGKLANRSHSTHLKSLLNREKNAYVRKTLEASLRRADGGRRAAFTYLPVFDSTTPRRLATYPSEKQRPEFSLSTVKKLDTGIVRPVPVARDRVFPHMQYKACRSIYEKVKQPFESFGVPGVSHVGEDCGWLFAGLPVHAVMDGRIVMIQHEESWGCLVGMESRLPDGRIVCCYYGHLSCNVDIFIGQTVKMGDKLGEIGPAFTFQNGGYRSHLHLGIEKASLKNALIAGYHEDIGRWYDPVEFIGNRSRREGK